MRSATIGRTAAVALAIAGAVGPAVGQATRPGDEPHPGRRVVRGGLPSGTALAVAREVVGPMDLPPAQRAAVNQIFDKARSDQVFPPRSATAAQRRGAAQHNADVDERARLDVEATLTAEQRPAYARGTAELTVGNERKRLGYLRAAAKDAGLSDDDRAAVVGTLDDHDRDLGRLLDDAKAVTDLDAAADLLGQAQHAVGTAGQELSRTLGPTRYGQLQRAANRLQFAAHGPAGTRPASRPAK